MTCTIIAAIVSCLGAMPAMTPAQAAAVLAPHAFVYVEPAGPGPHIIVIGNSPAEGPFGAFAPFTPSPSLDWSMSTYVGHPHGAFVGHSPFAPVVTIGPPPPLISTRPVARPR